MHQTCLKCGHRRRIVCVKDSYGGVWLPTDSLQGDEAPPEDPDGEEKRRSRRTANRKKAKRGAMKKTRGERKKTEKTAPPQAQEGEGSRGAGKEGKHAGAIRAQCPGPCPEPRPPQ